MNRAEALRVAASNATVSDKIRAMDAAGYSRAEIAKHLDKRYQHVRNVLEGDKLSRTSRQATSLPEPIAGVGEPAQAFHGVQRLALDADGSIRLPPALQAMLGVRPGGVLIAELEPDRLVILSHQANMAKLDVLMEPYRWRGGPLVSDQLIAERRAEAARDEAEARKGG